MEGYIKIYRQLLDWEWYTDTPTKSLFIHLLLRANIKDGNWRGTPVQKGSLITGRKKLSEELGLTESQVRTSLEKLESTNEITIKTTKSFSVIQVQNWDKYQETIANKVSNQSPTNRQPIATGETGNKERKQKENTNTVCFDIFWNIYPNKVGKPNALKKYKEQEHSQIIEGLEMWKEYWDYSNTEQRYIPHPATWLHQERYKDTPPEIKSNIISI